MVLSDKQYLDLKKLGFSFLKAFNLSTETKEDIFQEAVYSLLTQGSENFNWYSQKSWFIKRLHWSVINHVNTYRRQKSILQSIPQHKYVELLEDPTLKKSLIVAYDSLNPKQRVAIINYLSDPDYKITRQYLHKIRSLLKASLPQELF